MHLWAVSGERRLTASDISEETKTIIIVYFDDYIQLKLYSIYEQVVF